MAKRDWSLVMPHTALILIISKVDQSGRHGRNSLALVCRSWAEAVAAVDVLAGELHVDRCVLRRKKECASTTVM